jgi:nitrite reductase/ring-hydroxylating ferredoxin subunit
MSTEPSSPATPDLRDRRTVLRGAAAVGVAGVAAPLLAACGDDGGDATGGGATSPSSAPTSAPTSAPSSEPTSAPTSGSGGTVLGPASEIPVGGGKIYDQKVVVTQPTAGQYKGFSAICTHKQCPVREVAGGTINCKCHGSKFKIEDGSVANGPAASALSAVQVSMQGGNIVQA